MSLTRCAACRLRAGARLAEIPDVRPAAPAARSRRGLEAAFAERINMPAQSEMVLAKCTATAAAEDPDYRQSLRCGRHEMLSDERPVRGGVDAGPMPFEYLLAGLSACTSTTLRMYAQRTGWNIGAVAESVALHHRKEGPRG